MQDNFDIHNWRLKTAIQETEKIKGKDGKGCWKGYRYAGTENGKDKCIPIKENEGQCPDCGCEMESKMCNECGYTMEEATFTDKHNDNPELKGGQKELPDELQAKILNKEAITPLADLYDLVSELVKQGISKDEILQIVNFATAKLSEENEYEEN